MLPTCKSVKGTSVGRLQFVSTRLSAHEGRPRETPFKNLALGSFRLNATKIPEIACCHLLDFLIDHYGESLW